MLTTPELRALWDSELAEMRERIKAMRKRLVDKLKAARAGSGLRASSPQQRGMFCYSGLTKEQVQRLRERIRRSTASTPAASAWPR